MRTHRHQVQACLQCLISGCPRRFKYCCGLSGEQLRHLLEGNLLDMMGDALRLGAEALQQQVASSGFELSAKFAADAAFSLEYGSLETFFSGLEARR